MALPSDQPELRTGGILQREFKLIHGETQWNRSDPPTATQQLLLTRAWEELQSQSADSEERHRAEADAMLLAIHAWSVHGLPDPGQSALCLSGGGIRSAAFALGILQGLARRDVLKDFHYLSTVSGGGYIGGWFAAWRKRFGLNVVLRGWDRGTPAGSPKPGRYSACASTRTSLPPASASHPPIPGPWWRSSSATSC